MNARSLVPVTLLALASLAAHAENAPATSAPAGSSFVLTGVVVADRPATASAVGPDGALLAGVVVDVDGVRHTTDDSGKLRFIAPAGVATLTAVMATAGGPAAASADVRPPTAAPGTPMITRAPSHPSPGSTVTVSGESFDGDAENNRVQIGETEAEVLAVSPVELAVSVPADATVGEQSLTVTTPNGRSEPVDVEVTGIWFESGDTRLRSGQKGKGFVHVSSDEPLTVTVVNHSDVITLEGGKTTTVRTSGGKRNRAPIRYRANRPGAFHITAKIEDHLPPVADGEDDQEEQEDDEEPSAEDAVREANEKLRQAKDAAGDEEMAKWRWLNDAGRAVDAVSPDEDEPLADPDQARDTLRQAERDLERIRDYWGGEAVEAALEAVKRALGALGPAEETDSDPEAASAKDAVERAVARMRKPLRWAEGTQKTRLAQALQRLVKIQFDPDTGLAKNPKTALEAISRVRNMFFNAFMRDDLNEREVDAGADVLRELAAAEQAIRAQ